MHPTPTPAPVATRRAAPVVRDQTTLEEIFNALSHGLGLLLAIASLPILVYSAAQKGTAAGIVGASLFAGTAIVLYLISTLYHALPMGRAKAWFNRFDHAAIYLFIAGSYTPFAMLGLPTHTGKIILAIVWAGALAGVALKMLWPTAPKWVGVPLYLLLGWAIVPVVGELTHQVGVAPMVLLLVGGIFYSVGAILYATKWPNPWPTTFGHHEFFHAATVVAAICHYIAVWLVVFN